MPVIINELDVVVEPDRTAAQPSEAPSQTAAGLTARDLAQVVRHLVERAERVRAD